MLVVVAAVSAGAYSNTRELNAGKSAVGYVSVIPPTFTSYVPSNMVPALRAADGDLPLIYRNGCITDLTADDVKDCVFGSQAARLTYALFGDSHSSQWYPALEQYTQATAAKLRVFTRSSCPSADVDTGNEQCDRWRRNAIARLNSLKPDVVVISNLRGRLTDKDRLEVWSAGLKRTMMSMPKGTRVVVIGDTPAFKVSPPVCLSAHLTETSACTRRHEEAVDHEWDFAEQRAVELMGGAFVNMNDFLCTTFCGPVIGNVLMYRDSHHLSATASRALSVELGKRIEKALSTPL